MSDVDFSKIVFLDIETTGLDFERHVPWEVGVISGDGQILLHEMWKPDEYEMSQADPMALSMNNFYERMNDPTESQLRGHDAKWVASKLAVILNKKIISGAAVAFDMRMLDGFLRGNAQCPTWSHRSVDVQTQVQGAFGYQFPASLSDSAKRAGVPYDKDLKHTALYDAWLAREVYIACLAKDNMERPASIEFDKLRHTVGAPSMPTPPPMRPITDAPRA